MIKTGNELATACLNVAQNYNTLYVLGCFGAPMTASNKERYTKNLDYNAKEARKKMILAASEDTFGFDCVCLIKGLLWGWEGDIGNVYGGAKYASNGVPDIGADQIIEKCSSVSTDFSQIQVGELLWMKGHVGIYIGDGLAVECTPAWKNCVQVTAVHNIGKKTAYNGRKWTKHGKLPYVSYTSGLGNLEPISPTPKPTPSPDLTPLSVLPALKKGSKGDTVKSLQILLNGYGYDLGSYGVDSDFGSATEKAVREFQAEKNLEADGVVGPKTWAALLGV